MEKDDKSNQIDELIEGLVSVSLAAKRLTKMAMALKGGDQPDKEEKQDGKDE